MLTARSYHQQIVCRVLPDLAQMTHSEAQELIREARRTLPFKDKRNWILVFVGLGMTTVFVATLLLTHLFRPLHLPLLLEMAIVMLVVVPSYILLDIIQLRALRFQIAHLLSMR